MPIWDPSICYNDTHPRSNYHLELFLHLKKLSHDIELPTKTHGYYVKKADIITNTQTLPHVAHMGLIVEIKVITYQDEIKLEIGIYI